MPLPLIPLAIAGVGGGLAGGLVSSFLGDGGKKANTVSEQHSPYEHYAPVTTDASSLAQTFAPTYQYQIESPDAYMSSKKTLDTRAESEPYIAPERTAYGAGIATTEGTDMTKLLVVGAIGLVAYGLVTKK